MTNKHATECRNRIDQIGRTVLNRDEHVDLLEKVAKEYAARCDGLEATLARRDHPAFAPAWTAAR